MDCEATRWLEVVEEACGNDEELRHAVESLLADRNEAETFLETPAYRFADKRDNIKLTVVGTPDVILRAQERIRGEMGTVVAASRSKPRFLDVTAFGWDKGALLKRMGKLLSVPYERIAAIGDGPNDVGMFQQAVLSIAMGQAVDQVKQQAIYVTASNDEDGWARGIEQYILRRKR